MKIIKLLAVINFIILVQVNSKLYSQSDTLDNLLQKHCKEEIREGYKSQMQALIIRLPKNTKWENTAEKVVPNACKREFPGWLLERTMNLGIYGIENQVNPEIIPYLTLLMEVKTVGKKDYQILGSIFEHSLETGINHDEIMEIFSSALEKGYRTEPIYALVVYYIQLRIDKQKHEEAVMEAFSYLKDYKSAVDRDFIFKKIFFSKDINSWKSSEEFLAEFWLNSKGKIKKFSIF